MVLVCIIFGAIVADSQHTVCDDGLTVLIFNVAYEESHFQLCGLEERHAKFWMAPETVARIEVSDSDTRVFNADDTAYSEQYYWIIPPKRGSHSNY